jgi:hypothetical protein
MNQVIMKKVVFKELPNNQPQLFPENLLHPIPENHPVRLVDEVVELLDISSILRKYKGGGAYETEFFDASAKEFAFLVGYQTESGNFLLDYYLGLGYKSKSFPESFYCDDNSLQYSKESTSNFVVLLGLRVGLLF